MTIDISTLYPEPKVYGNTYLFECDHYKATMERVSEHGRTIYGELTVTQNGFGLYGPANFGLNGSRPGADANRELNTKSEENQLYPLHWNGIIEHICRKTVAKYREGGPIVYVGLLNSPGIQWLEKPILLKNQMNWIYGMGGTGKSFYTRLIACQLRLECRAIPLILDWETDADTEDERIKAIAKGLGADGLELAYRQMSQRLADQIDSIGTQVAREKIDLLIVDSVGRALSGDSLKEDLLLQMLNALNSLKVTCWLIDHTNDRGELYGNSYKFHQARNIWEVKSERETDEESFVAAFFNRKNNNRSLQPPFAKRFSFFNEGATECLSSVIVEDTGILSLGAYDAELSMPRRIEETLKTTPNGHMPRELLQEAAIGDRPSRRKQDKFRQALSRLQRNRKIVTLPNSDLALGQV